MMYLLEDDDFIVMWRYYENFMYLLQGHVIYLWEDYENLFMYLWEDKKEYNRIHY